MSINSHQIQETIIALATKRGADKSICPSEVARALYINDWRQHMANVREAALQLQQKGLVYITQNGKPVGTQPAKGPIRIKIVNPAPDGV